jgi:hypothetical protein
MILSLLDIQAVRAPSILWSVIFHGQECAVMSARMLNHAILVHAIKLHGTNLTAFSNLLTSLNAHGAQFQWIS